MPASTTPAPSTPSPSSPPTRSSARSGRVRRVPALLVLEDGTTFGGSSFGAVGETFGEAVFATGMSGYQETLTDPSYHRQVVAVLRSVLEAEVPCFGICFGNQLFGRALGFGTYKLGYGHRGINQPVMDLSTRKVEITAHNHGFAVDAPREGRTRTPYGWARVSHVGLND